MICIVAAGEKFLKIHRNATESLLVILATLTILLTAQEMKFSINLFMNANQWSGFYVITCLRYERVKDFFSKCDQIRWSHLPKKSLMERFYFLCSD